MFTIHIIGGSIKPIEIIQSAINPIGVDSISTEKAHYYVTESSVDFRTNVIILHVSDDIHEFD